jgi:alpha-ribazole phosphatase
VRLHLLRHTAPIVAPGICYGRSDVAAEPIAADALARLRAQLPAGAPLYSSPLRRCTELAHALDIGAPMIDARLAELDFGRWELQRWDDIARAEIDAWAQDIAFYRPGGGECAHDMARRVAAFCDELGRAPHPDAVVVCHAGTMRLLAARERGLAPAEMARAAAAEASTIAYGALLTLHFPAVV